jgi:hypothetical protein
VNYDFFPETAITKQFDVYAGEEEILELIRKRMENEGLNVITIESYPVVKNDFT